jgi:hypothetical protein
LGSVGLLMVEGSLDGALGPTAGGLGGCPGCPGCPGGTGCPGGLPFGS